MGTPVYFKCHNDFHLLFNVRYFLLLSKRLLTDIPQFSDAREVREKPEDELQNKSIELKKLQNLKMLNLKINVKLSWVKHKKGQI